MRIQTFECQYVHISTLHWVNERERERENSFQKVIYTGKQLLGRNKFLIFHMPLFLNPKQIIYFILNRFSNTEIYNVTKNDSYMIVKYHSLLLSPLKTFFHPCHKKTCLSVREVLK